MINNHKLILIAAVDNNWAIGKDNLLLYDIPTDMKFFRETTMGSIVVYGYNTLMSFPRKSPLPLRDNIVLTSRLIHKDNLIVTHSVQEVLKTIELFDDDRPVYICGGASVYKQFVDLADEAYITKIDACTPDADAFFPELKPPYWNKKEVLLSAHDSKSGLDMQIERYLHEKT